MTINELLSKPHFIISEYLGEFVLEEEDYNSIQKGTLLELDENVSKDKFVQTFSLFIEEWTSVIDLFEKFVDEFYAKAPTSCWIHRNNPVKICKEGTDYLNIFIRYLKAHSTEDYPLLHLMQLNKTYCAALDRFTDAIDRFKKYIVAYTKIMKITNIAKNVDITEAPVCETFKQVTIIMNELTNIIDDHNLYTFNNESLREYYDLCMFYIDIASNIIECGKIEDDANLINDMKTNSAKLKLMAFQLSQYMCQG